MKRERILNRLCEEFETAISQRSILWRRFEVTSRVRIILAPPTGAGHLQPASREYTAEERVIEARDRLIDFLTYGTVPADLEESSVSETWAAVQGAGDVCLIDPDGMTIPCSERRLLENAYREARAALSAAHTRLQGAAGILPREKRERLQTVVGQTRTALQRASELLCRHMREHGCDLTETSASQ